MKFDKTLYRIETDTEVLSLWSLFLPLFFQLVLQNMLGTVNTVMLSHYSEGAVAAVGAASQLTSMILNFYSVVSMGAGVVISQYLGANRREMAEKTAETALLMGLAMGILIGMALALFSRPLLSLMQLKGTVLEQAVLYFRILMSFSVLQAVLAVFNSILNSYGLPKISVGISLLMNILNLLLNFVVIFRPFETPLRGVSGIAVSVVISEAVSVLLMTLFFLRLPIKIRTPFSGFQKIFKISRSILSVGVPGGISNISYSLSQVVSTSIIAVIGVDAISAKVYLTNIFFYVYVLGLALGHATSLMISRYAGAHEFEKAYRLNLQNLVITVAVNVSVSTAIFLFGGSIMRLFTENPSILEMSRPIMLIDIAVEAFRALNHIEGNALCSTGDSVFPMVISILSCWLVSIVFSYVFGIRCHLGLAGCWIAFGMDEAFRGTACVIRWNSKKWTTKTVT